MHKGTIIIVTIRADFQQGMESVSKFKMNTVTENSTISITGSFMQQYNLIMWGNIFNHFVN